MTYAAEVLSDAPWLYWKLDEVSGSAAADSSGNARPGAYVGDAILDQANTMSRDGVVFGGGNSPYFNGSLTTGSVTATLTGFTPTDLTFEFWMADLDSLTNAGLVSYSSASSIREMQLFSTSTSSWATYMRGSAIQSFAPGKVVINTDRNHVVVTWRNSDGRLETWINGRKAQTVSGVSTGLTINAGGQLALMQHQGTLGGGGFANANRGYMGHFALYTSVLSDARIAAHWAAGAAVSAFSVTGVEAPTLDLRFADAVAFADSTYAVTLDGFGSTRSIYQRVWDITNTRWCYYSSSTQNPSPGVGDTSPVNSGNLSDHTVLAVVYA